MQFLIKIIIDGDFSIEISCVFVISHLKVDRIIREDNKGFFFNIDS